MSSLLGVRFSGPLESYTQGFAAELAEQGYKPLTGIKPQLFLVAHLSRWLAERDLEPWALVSPEVVEEFLAGRRAAGYANYRTVKALAPQLAYLRALELVGPAPEPELTPGQVLLERYRGYLTSERGLTAATARGYVDAVRGFVTGREVGGELDLAGLTAEQVTGFVVETCAGHTRGSANMTVTALRSLLGFLHVDGILETSLVAAVTSAASWRLVGLPKGLGPGQVSRLLAACDRRTPRGRRGKGDRHERLPLPDDVGTALVGYL